MNEYQKAIEVIDTLLHLMCGEEREDGHKPTMEEMSKSMYLLQELVDKETPKKSIDIEFAPWSDLMLYGGGGYFIELDEFKAILKQMEELGWIAEKPETNFEHYFEYLSKLNMSDFALIDGRVVQCLGTHCRGCDFNGDCIERKFKWLKQPYEKTTFKLTQFEYDLLNAYKNSGMRQCISNYGTLLEMYGKGHFKGIDTSTPIREILDNCKVV